MKALIFDTETTGLILNRTIKLDKQPHVIEYFGHIVDLKTEKVTKVVSQLIKPPIPLPLKVKGDLGIADITGISEEMLDGQPHFKEVAQQIKEQIEGSGVTMAIAHNLSFDKEMLEIEFERLGMTIKWPKKMVCTVEQTIHLRGRRLKQTELYQYLFPGETYVAHRASNDVLALTRCCVQLHKRGII